MKKIRADQKPPLFAKLGTVFQWSIGEQVFDCTVDCACPTCHAVAVVSLPPPLLKEQRDGTTHVCHPAFGGCNGGFTIDTGEAAPADL